MTTHRPRPLKSVSTMVAAALVVSFALTPKADAVLAAYVHILKNDAETQFHLAEIEVFANGVTPDGLGGATSLLGGLTTSLNDLGQNHHGDVLLATFGDGNAYPSLGTTNSLQHGSPNQAPNNALEVGTAVWTTNSGLATPSQYTLDLGGSRDVTTVRLYPRNDTCCEERWQNLETQLLDSNRNPIAGTLRSFVGTGANMALEYTFTKVLGNLSIAQDTPGQVEVRWLGLTDDRTHLESTTNLGNPTIWEPVPEEEILIDPAPYGRVYTDNALLPRRFFRLKETPLGAGSWQVLPNSPVAPYYHHDDLFFIDEHVGWLCNISGEIWKTTDGGDSWIRVFYKPSASFRTLTFADEMRGWVGNLGNGGWAGSTDRNVIYSTTDGGLTWTPVTAADITGPVPDGICGLQAIGPNTIRGTGRYAGDAYFISSTDGGATWISQNLDADFDAFVDVLFFTPDRGYITGSDRNEEAVLLYTTDGGANWTTAMSNSGAYHYWKIGFADPFFGYGVCWYGPDANKWIQTHDGGQTWTDREYTEHRNDCDANGIGFIDEQTGWIGCHQPETYETTDGGESWHFIKIDPVYDDSINKFLRVGDVMYGIGNRIYKYSAEPVGPAKRAEIDNSLCAIAATPNPSNGTTTITYTVPADDNVQITIYVRGGFILDRPIDEHQQAGTYSFEFQAQDLPSALKFNSRDKNPAIHASIVTGRYRQMVKFNNPKPLKRPSQFPMRKK